MFSVLHAVPVVGKWETIQRFIELVSTSGDWLLQPMELQERSKDREAFILETFSSLSIKFCWV